VRGKIGVGEPEDTTEILAPATTMVDAARDDDRKAVAAREQAPGQQDVVDELARLALEQEGGWETVVAPMVEPVVEALESLPHSASWDDVISVLDGLRDRMDHKALQAALLNGAAYVRALAYAGRDDASDTGDGRG
jgi:phage gp29-like protein